MAHKAEFGIVAVASFEPKRKIMGQANKVARIQLTTEQLEQLHGEIVGEKSPIESYLDGSGNSYADLYFSKEAWAQLAGKPVPAKVEVTYRLSGAEMAQFKRRNGSDGSGARLSLTATGCKFIGEFDPPVRERRVDRRDAAPRAKVGAGSTNVGGMVAQLLAEAGLNV